MTGTGNTAFGHFALVNAIGSSNIAVGDSAGRSLTTGDNDIDIGNAGKAGESNTIRLGNQAVHTATFIAGISAIAVTGRQVLITSNGKLGVAVSSARFKDNIQPMNEASEAILALKPVTFRYKEEIDSDKTPQFGLIAEDVEKVNPDLIARDADGKVMTVRYEAVNAMLLNEFLKEHRKAAEEHRKVEEQGRTIQELKGLVTNQQKQIEKLTAGLQRVSDEVELAKPVPEGRLAND